MILEDEGKAINHYNENVNLRNVEGVGIGMEAYMTNRGEAYDRVRHDNLHADIVEHIFNAQTNPLSTILLKTTCSTIHMRHQNFLMDIR